MDHYHIPHHIWGMSTSYLGDNKLWFQSAMFTTKWQPVEKGTETGFTISPILFAWISRQSGHSWTTLPWQHRPMCRQDGSWWNWMEWLCGQGWSSSPKSQGAWWSKKTKQLKGSGSLFKEKRSWTSKRTQSNSLKGDTTIPCPMQTLPDI